MSTGGRKFPGPHRPTGHRRLFGCLAAGLLGWAPGLLTAATVSSSGFAGPAGSYTGFIINDDGIAVTTIVLTGLEPGGPVEFSVSEEPGHLNHPPGPDGGTVLGFYRGVGLGRTLAIEAPAASGGMTATVAITFTADELSTAGLEPADAQLHRLDADQNPPRWVPAETNRGRAGPAGVIGTCGYVVNEDASVTFWMVADRVGHFAVGAAEPPPDADGDGTPDEDDDCPDDPDKTEPGPCGCGQPDADADLDGSADCLDLCPSDPAKTQPGVCGCHASEAADLDTDADDPAENPSLPGMTNETAVSAGNAATSDPVQRADGSASDDADAASDGDEAGDANDEQVLGFKPTLPACGFGAIEGLALAGLGLLFIPERRRMGRG
ncbi:MAG: hypothetical protein HRF43_15325 [Phycisphaerae bacterium]|jgi:hypothetical protein